MGGTDFERGVKQGEDDALLKQHTRHLDAINGSIADSAAALTRLTETMRAGFAVVEDAVRTLQEEGRAAVLALEVAAETLAKETERRRSALADEGVTSDRKLSGRQVLVGMAALCIPVVLFVATKLWG